MDGSTGSRVATDYHGLILTLIHAKMDMYIDDLCKMAWQVEARCALLIEKNKFCQNTNVTNQELPCEYGNELLVDSRRVWN